MSEQNFLYSKTLFFNDDFPFAITGGRHSSARFGTDCNYQREFWKIIYVIEGEAEEIVDGQSYPIRPGSLMLIHPLSKTRFRYHSPYLDIHNIVFMPELIDTALRDIRDDFNFFSIFRRVPEHQELYMLDEDKKCRSVIRELIAEYEAQQPNFRTMIRLRLAELLILMARKGVRRFKAHRDDNVAGYVDHMIARHFREPLSLDTLCSSMGIGKSRLCLVYRRTTGRTITAALRAARLAEAERLLADSALDISEICFRCGFNDLSYFYRSFAEMFGRTPLEHRRFLLGRK